MSPLVVDASVVAKWFFDEPFSRQATSLLRQGNTLHAPDFLLYEMDAVFCKRCRRSDISPEEAEEGRALLRRMPVELHPTVPVEAEAFRIACRSGTALYDCLYLALALALGVKLVTADERFLRSIQSAPLQAALLGIERV